MKPETLFTEQDRKTIAEAIKQAELSTSGEIVPFVIGQSDSYPEAIWRGGTLGAFLVLFILSIIDIGTSVWLPVGITETVLITIIAFGIGALKVMFIPWLKLLLVPGHTLQRRVDERAAAAFLAEEVFATRERTGILIFLSLFERRVCVLGDSGINAKVKQEEWDGIVQLIIDGMKARKPADGLLKAIGKCGELLEKHGVQIREDDTNELDNSIRMRNK